MSSTTLITRLASAGSTVGTRLIVRDTVAVDTFALLAISRMSMDYDLAEFLPHRIQIPSLNQCKHKRPNGPIKIQIAPARKMMRSCDAVIPHHVTRSSETACLGRSNFSVSAPLADVIHSGDDRSCNCPAASNLRNCSSEGCSGEPIAFHTSNASL